MSGSGGIAIPNVQEWSGGSPGSPGVVGRPSGMSGSDREVLPDARERSGGPHGYPGVVGMISQISVCG